MKRIVSFIIASLLLFSLFSCGKEEEIPEEYYGATFFAMDTEVTVKLARTKGAVGEDDTPLYFNDNYLSGIIKECADIAETYEAKFSRTRDGSPVSEINKEIDYLFDVDQDVASLIESSREITKNTDGAFDITVGTVTELWNVTADEPAVPKDGDVKEALSHVGMNKIELKENDVVKSDKKTKIDFGGIAKGFTLGKIIEYLKSTDIVYGLVSFGGNVGVFGSKGDGLQFKVGITDAIDPSKVSGYVYISSGFVSVSGDYERYFTSEGVKYSHIFDPSTARPADTDISGVAVICNDASLADALSTALFVKGSEASLEFYNKGVYNFEALIQTKDGNLVMTPSFQSLTSFEKYVETETDEN